jgi:hypothetical protein
VTRKQGDDYAKTIAGIESDLPQGVDAFEALEQLDGTLGAFLSKREAKPAEQPKPKLTLDPAEIERLEWKPYHEGHSAGWIFTDKAPRTLTEALEKGPVTLGQFTYKYSGPEEKPKLFVSRGPMKE